ncbi:hypothetical protein C8R43DRAFT_885007, partial [Mycena crocata]
MSSFNILGFFKLKSGRRSSVQKPDSNYLTYHAHYETHVWCADNTPVKTDIHVYTTSTTPLLDDHTMVFAICTAHLPPTTGPATATVLLDALIFIVIPGNPTSSTYNDQLPDERTTYAYGLGRVNGGPQILDDGHSSRVINVAVSDYVRN